MIVISVCHDPPLVGQFQKFISLEWKRRNAALLNSSKSFVVWLMLAMLLHYDYIIIHHKVLFPVFLHATNHRKELPNAWMPWTFDVLEEAAALHSIMHDAGDEAVRYFATNQHHRNLSTSQLHMKLIPFLSDIPLHQRQCSLACALAAKLR